ncbi:MAG: sigma-54 dependent transcriptional regulator [bacterium]|nr:sigma-54 dependent transcriptional regulator [bacterium]
MQVDIKIFIQQSIIMLTGYGSINTAVKAMKFGAYDYLTKPVNNDELKLVIKKAIESRKLTMEVMDLRRELQERFRFGNIIGKSPQMQDVYTLIETVAPQDVTVLIHGDSGTGKELVAKAIHYNSMRKDKPFQIVDCATLPETLVESELFGYEKGAFTGATGRKIGKFDLSHGGTLFLDEIGNLTPNVQMKLLRAIQERKIERLGGKGTIPIDTRIIAATNKKLEDEVKIRKNLKKK